MTTLLADYDRERQAFEALLTPDCRKRILLFCGASGCGKTTLLSACLEQVPAAIPCIPIQLRGSAVSVAEVFYRSGHRLSWERLSRFTAQVATLQGVPQVQIDHNWLLGINNRISVALHAEEPTDREHRRAALTEAWFQDLQAFDHPVLMALDTYEQATAAVTAWIDGPFLSRVAQVSQLRVLLAGQEVPEAHNIEWGHCCTAHHLCGVPEAEHWWPIVEAMNRRVNVPDPRSWLAGVCHALGGRPKEIMQVIQDLPRRGREA
ncbi:MAG: ATP-binding protein [Chloroflexi bacterium]|nr:ATP-binding protein [Chloroflexota bacterium]